MVSNHTQVYNNWSGKDDVYTLLNLACYKYTTSFLPESCGTANNWGYCLADDRKKAVWSPNPYFHPLKNTSLPNDFHHQVCRSLVIGEIREILDYSNLKTLIAEELAAILWITRNFGYNRWGGETLPEVDEYFWSKQPDTCRAITNSLERVRVHPDANNLKLTETEFIRFMFNVKIDWQGVGLLRLERFPNSGQFKDRPEKVVEWVLSTYDEYLTNHTLKLYKFFYSIPFYNNPSSVREKIKMKFNKPEFVKNALRANNSGDWDSYRPHHNQGIHTWWISRKRSGYSDVSGRATLQLREEKIFERKLQGDCCLTQTGAIAKNKKAIQRYYDLILMAIGMSYCSDTLKLGSGGYHQVPWIRDDIEVSRPVRPFARLDSWWREKYHYQRLEKEPQLPPQVLIRIYNPDKAKEKRILERKIIKNFSIH
mgnify:CR=1 FL=1